MEKTHIHIASSNTMPKEQETNSEKVNVIVNSKAGLFSVRAIVFLLLWYLFSGCTLFLNKYILKYLDGNPWILGKYKVGSFIWISALLLLFFYIISCLSDVDDNSVWICTNVLSLWYVQTFPKIKQATRIF